MHKELFDDRDALVVIDDWKAGRRTPLAPAYFSGRLFLRSDPTLPTLYELLSRDDASDWHASGSRGEAGFLFDAPHFEQIVAIVGESRSVLCDQLSTANGFATADIAVQWHAIRSKSEAARVWPSDDVQGLALFRFGQFLCGHLGELLPQGTRVRLLVDRVTWFGSLSPIDQGSGLASLGCGGHQIHAEFLTILSKTARDVRPYMPILGLVDSEAWAFGRFQSLKFPDGSTVRERLLAWRANGADLSVRLFSEEEFQQLVAPHASHQNLLRYWQLWSEWGTMGRTLYLTGSPFPEAVIERSARILRALP